jgi:biopolymer transport protein ExbB
MVNMTLLQITLTQGADTVKNAVQNAPLTQTAPPPTQATLTLWDLLEKGGIVMIPIAILFAMAIYVFIERLIVLGRAGSGPHNFIANIRDFIHGGNIDAAKAMCKSSNSGNAKMIEKGLSRLGKPVEEIEKSMEDVGKLEVYRLEKNLNVMSVVGRIAPMLGFIGTIIGVINIFYKVSLEKKVDIDIISEGLYQKMISSAAGLTVGILAFAFYHICNAMVERKTHRMESDAIEFIDIIQMPGK